MRVYVNTLRSMPLVMVMFWIYMIVPMISGRSLSAYWSALIALTCFEVAYFTEIVRAGVQSISSNQFAAAVATGLSRFQAARYVVIPQALQRMLPALLTQSLMVAVNDQDGNPVAGQSVAFAASPGAISRSSSRAVITATSIRSW